MVRAARQLLTQLPRPHNSHFCGTICKPNTLVPMYHQFTNSDGSTYGSFETFFDYGDTITSTEPGWYWHACSPGCLPDGDASGPFENEQEAIKDATE